MKVCYKSVELSVNLVKLVRCAIVHQPYIFNIISLHIFVAIRAVFDLIDCQNLLFTGWLAVVSTSCKSTTTDKLNQLAASQ